MQEVLGFMPNLIRVALLLPTLVRDVTEIIGALQNHPDPAVSAQGDALAAAMNGSMPKVETASSAEVPPRAVGTNPG